MQIPDFRQGYESIPEEDRCDGFDELFMTIYDKVVKTWNTGAEKKTKLDKPYAINYLVPVTICKTMKPSLCKKHNFKPGDTFDSMTDMKNKCNIKNLSQISYWKRMGWIKNVIE